MLELRCSKCGRLFGKINEDHVEIKCHRCGTFNTFKVFIDKLFDKTVSDGV